MKVAEKRSVLKRTVQQKSNFFSYFLRLFYTSTLCELGSKGSFVSTAKTQFLQVSRKSKRWGASESSGAFYSDRAWENEKERRLGINRLNKCRKARATSCKATLKVNYFLFYETGEKPALAQAIRQTPDTRALVRECITSCFQLKYRLCSKHNTCHTAAEAARRVFSQVSPVKLSSSARLVTCKRSRYHQTEAALKSVCKHLYRALFLKAMTFL